MKRERIASDDSGGAAAERAGGAGGQGGEAAAHAREAQAAPPDEGPSCQANSIEFLHLCQAFREAEKVPGNSGPARTRAKLEILFSPRLREMLKGQTIFPLLRLVLPELDARQYGLKESKLAKTLVDAFGFPEQSEAAKRIMNWKAGAFVKADAVGLGITVFNVFEHERSEDYGSRLTVGAVNEELDKLSLCAKDDERRRVLVSLLTRMCALELRYLVCIVLKDLKIGVAKDPALRWLHQDALDQYALTLNLRKVCSDIKVPGVRLTPSLTWGTQCLPMLCELSRTIVDCFRRFAAGSDVAVEVKMDGERVIVHWDRDDEAGMRLFSRRGNDLDAMFQYGKVVRPHLRHAVDRRVRRAIFDGELVPWDKDTGQSTFGHSRAIAKEANAIASEANEVLGSGRTLRVMLFDLLYCEGELGMEKDPRHAREPKLTGLPLEARRRVLEHVIKETPPECELIKQVVIPHGVSVEEKSRQIAAELDKVIVEGGEGLVIKSRSAPYTHDARDARLWTKLKPEQMAGLAETVDVLVLGGYNAVSAARSGGVDGFLVGVRATPRPGEDPHNPQRFLTLGKAGVGFSRQDIEAWRERLRTCEMPWPATKNDVPPHLDKWWPIKSDDKPDVWYKPSESFVLEIACAQLVPSRAFSAGYTFRFPRVVRERGDKQWYQCLDLDKVKLLANEKPAGHLGRDQDSRRDQVEASKAKKPAPASARPRAGNTSQLWQEQCVFNGARRAGWPEVFVTVQEDGSKSQLTVYLLPFELDAPLIFPALLKPEDPPCKISSSRDVGLLVTDCGGKVFAIESEACRLFVAPPPSAAPDELIRIYAAKDLMTIEYVLACIRAGYIVAPLFEHYANVSATRREAHKGEYDKFREHFFEPSTQRSLAAAMAAASHASKGSTRDPAALADLLLEEHDPLLTKQSPLRGALLYVDQFHDLVADDGGGDMMDVDEGEGERRRRRREPREGYTYSMIEAATLLAQQAGARIAPAIAPGVTHIVLDAGRADCKERKMEAVNMVSLAVTRDLAAGRHARMPFVVSHAWLLAVIDSHEAWERTVPFCCP